MAATRESNQVPVKRSPLFTRPPTNYSEMLPEEKAAWCLAVAMQIHANAQGQEKISNDEENLPT
jgi:hypothetical protein